MSRLMKDVFLMPRKACLAKLIGIAGQTNMQVDKNVKKFLRGGKNLDDSLVNAVICNLNVVQEDNDNDKIRIKWSYLHFVSRTDKASWIMVFEAVSGTFIVEWDERKLIVVHFLKTTIIAKMYVECLFKLVLYWVLMGG
ncbi:hypothetical protein Tco_1260316, partial [Tanacetum coccineum]